MIESFKFNMNLYPSKHYDTKNPFIQYQLKVNSIRSESIELPQDEIKENKHCHTINPFIQQNNSIMSDQANKEETNEFIQLINCNLPINVLHLANENSEPEKISVLLMSDQAETEENEIEEDGNEGVSAPVYFCSINTLHLDNESEGMTEVEFLSEINTPCLTNNNDDEIEEYATESIQLVCPSNTTHHDNGSEKKGIRCTHERWMKNYLEMKELISKGQDLTSFLKSWNSRQMNSMKNQTLLSKRVKLLNEINPKKKDKSQFVGKINKKVSEILI